MSCQSVPNGNRPLFHRFLRLERKTGNYVPPVLFRGRTFTVVSAYWILIGATLIAIITTIISIRTIVSTVSDGNGNSSNWY